MAEAFVTLSNLEDYLGRTLTGDNATAGTLCVKAASDICRDVAEQTFTRGTTTGTFDGTGTDSLLLPESPVNSVGTVAVFELEGTTNVWDTVGTADYSVNVDGILYATDRAGTATLGRAWPAGRQNVRVTYDHGAETVPQSVHMVALTVASRLLIQGPAIFENLGDLNIRYAAESTALMATEKLILRKYKRTR